MASSVLLRGNLHFKLNLCKTSQGPCETRCLILEVSNLHTVQKVPNLTHVQY